MATETATEQVPSTVTEETSPIPQLQSVPQVQPLQAWLARLGLSGKLLVIGGLVGVVAVFLPLLSMSMSTQMQTPTTFGNPSQFGSIKGAPNVPAAPAVSSSQSVMVAKDWRGVLCLVGYLAALALTFVLYPPTGLGQKNLGWAGVGVGALSALLALWLLAIAIDGSSSVGFGGIGFQISVGIGAILNLLAGATVATGGFLKAREEKLI